MIMVPNAEWISNSLLNRILEGEDDFHQNKIRILNADIKAATNKGDNYASEMYRAVIEYEQNGERNTCNRILKVCLKSSAYCQQ